jgi:hypothetical protein
MKKYLLPVLFILLAPASTVAQSATETEVTEAILENFRYLNENLTNKPGTYSSQGALEFWSSGGLLNEVSNRDTDEYDVFSITPKHIRVIPIVEGQAAVAHYYSEGALQPKGFPGVSHYMTRATQVFVKEGGEWKVRSSHWSPISAGSGTTQTVQ